MSQQITGAMEPGWAWRGAGRMRACGIRGPACLQDHESECSHRRQYVPRNHMVWALGASRGSCWASLVTQTVKNSPTRWETWVRSLGWEDAWRRAWQPIPVFLPGESPWTEEPGGLQSMGLQRVGHDWATKHRDPWYVANTPILTGKNLL